MGAYIEREYACKVLNTSEQTFSEAVLQVDVYILQAGGGASPTKKRLCLQKREPPSLVWLPASSHCLASLHRRLSLANFHYFLCLVSCRRLGHPF